MKKILCVCLTLSLALASFAALADDNVLVIYSPNSDTEVDNIIPAFEDATGIQVELLSMGTGECVTRIDSEKDNPQADVMWGGMNYGVYVQHPDLWADYTSPNEALIDEGYRQGEVKAYSNSNLSGSGCLIINNELAKELGVTITGYNDLLKPELKGKIASGDPTKSSSAWAELTNMLLVMGEEAYDEKAWEFVEKFVAQLDGIQLDSSSAIYKGVANGEYVVGVSYEDPCIQMLASGADVSVVYPIEGTVWLPAATAIVKGAPHEKNAQAFIDFQLSDAGQSIYAGLTTRAVNSRLPLGNEYMKPFSEINVVYEDIPYCAEHKTEWQARYAEIRDRR
ncbi:MAG: extracellular solute-binding protein [Clostridiales bacterium]|nr:extracellular solute-binding protein [Clostridiales bacterium]